MARVLVVIAREPEPDQALKGLTGIALRFLNEAQGLSGACRNRMDSQGGWADEPALGDWWGRCIWGLGTVAAHSVVAHARQMAIAQFDRGAQARSTCPRAMAFAALGAAELLSVEPEHRAAREIITDYADSIPPPTGAPPGPWPEPRLTYANVVLSEAMIAAGVALDNLT